MRHDTAWNCATAANVKDSKHSSLAKSLEEHMGVSRSAILGPTLNMQKSCAFVHNMITNVLLLCHCFRVELDLLLWLQGLNLLSPDEISQGFSSLAQELPSGVLLAQVVEAVGGCLLPGVNMRPLSEAARKGNQRRVLLAAHQLLGSRSRCVGL